MEIVIIVLIIFVSIYVFGCLIYILNEFFHFIMYDSFLNSSTFGLVLFDSLFWPGDLMSIILCELRINSKPNIIEGTTE